MKRAVFIFVLVLCVAFAFSCKTAATIKEATTAEEENLREIYARYRTGLDLRGADKYTVVSGDSLSQISRAKYDDSRYFPVIMLASSDVVLDKDKIEIGDILTVPDLQRNLNNPRAKLNIKNFLLDIAQLEETQGRDADAEAIRSLADTL